MNTFALGYGSAMSVAFVAWLVAMRTTQRPDPPDWIRESPPLLLAAITICLAGWALVWGSLSQLKELDVRARFRAADPRGRWSFLAGFVTAWTALGSAVLAHRLLEPSGEERDLNTIRAGLLSLLSVGFGWTVGVVMFLSVFRPRTTQEPAQETSERVVDS